MADFPPLGATFSSARQFKLAVYEASVHERVKMVLTRSEATQTHMVCNALGIKPPSSACSLKLAAKLEDGRWVVHQRITMHSHSVTEYQAQAAQERAIAGLSKYKKSTRKAVPDRAGRGSSNEVSSGDDDGALSDLMEGEDATPRKTLPSGKGRYPSFRDARAEIELLLSRTPGLLPFPTPSMLFPDSRALVIYLHAATRQRGFTLYRITPFEQKTDVKFYCSLGHSQCTQRPLCLARYHAVEGPHGWHMVNDTFTGHTHVIRDDAGNQRHPPTHRRTAERDDSTVETPSEARKRPRTESFSNSPGIHVNRITRPTPPPAHPRPIEHLGRSPAIAQSPRPLSRLSSSFSRPSLPSRTLNTSFLPSLSRFMSSLHPRLACLAPTLLEQAGLDSTERLILFLTLSETDQNLDRVLKDLPGVPPLDRHLLKKELKRVRDAGWAPSGRQGGADAILMAQRVVREPEGLMGDAQMVKSEV